MSLADQVTNLTNDRNNIRTSLINKGITEAADHGFSSFDEDIDAMVKPEGTITVTENGEYDVTEREGIIVDVYTVTPIESPEAEIGNVKSGGTLRVVWNTVPNAVCYTLERKHGDNGVWTVIRTLVTTSEESYEYLDADVISGDYYYYRVYAISNGAVYGNSLSSNVASAMAPYGGGVVDLFAPNDFCEDVTGGWIVEPYPCEPSSYPPRDIDPYIPSISADGYMDVTKGGSSSSGTVWLHTINPINFQCNDVDIFERAPVTFRRVGSYTSIMVGLFKKHDDDTWECHKLNGSFESFYTETFIFDNEATGSGSPRVKPGDYYLGFVIYDDPRTRVQVSTAQKIRRTWDGWIFDGRKNDPEFETITGGYYPSSAAYYNPVGWTVYAPQKSYISVYYGGETYNAMRFYNENHGAYVMPFITGKMIDFGGFDSVAIYTNLSLSTTQGNCVVYLDDNMNVVGSEQILNSVYGYYYASISEAVKRGGKYYLSIQSYGENNVQIIKMQLI